MKYTYQILQEAIEKYGTDMQQVIAIEEMSELQKELCKWKRGCNNIDDIAEEIADVRIMLEQLEIIFDCTSKVDKWIDCKMSRLRERLEK